jgi:hypothetical protein
LVLQWYKNSKIASDEMRFDFDHGDLYVMSEKTVGNDFRNNKIFALRHCAGADKFIKCPQSDLPDQKKRETKEISKKSARQSKI